MAADFSGAADRHWQDAAFLFEAERLANADHLFGLSAECGLKAVMSGVGMVLRPDGAPKEPEHRVHINTLWELFFSFIANREGAEYASCLHPKNPFDDWDVSQRYCACSFFKTDLVDTHQQGAKQVMNLLARARLDGVVA